MSSTLAETIVAIRAGSPVIVPTDTVYGLACTPHEAEPVRLLSRLKGRDEGQPIVMSQPDSEHAKVYRRIAARVWEKVAGPQRGTPKIVIE